MSRERFGSLRPVFAVAAALALLAAGTAGDARTEGETLTIGIVTFLSGGAAGPFGVPAYNAAEIVLLVNPPDVVHSSFWGADLEAFILQGSACGVFDDSLVALSAGAPAMFRLASQIPEGTVIGARGPHGVLAPESELNDWFRRVYQDRFALPPIYPS